MSDFKKAELNEYKATLSCEHCADRTVVIVGESEDAAQAQLGKFVEHLNGEGEHQFEAGPVEKLEGFHVTYTEAAWLALKEIG